MKNISFDDFESAGRAVLSYLHQRFGFGLWMVTRTEGEEWIVLQAEDHGYNVSPGAVFLWADTFCSEMVKGNGPHIAPDSDRVPAYAAAAIGQQVPIKAYMGFPLIKADGSLFGTLCAIDPACQPESIVEGQAQIELLAGLLSALLKTELALEVETRRKDRLEMEAHTDALTGVSNRRAWDQLLAREEERCRRYGHPAAVLIMDLDHLKAINDANGHAAGDALIARAAQALADAARDIDVVARLGGDEFGIIAIECDKAGADALLVRTRAILAEQGIEASVGVAVREHFKGLKGAWEEADRRMYAEKKSRSL